MGRLKTTYADASNKKIVREFLLQKFHFEQVVGLAGPDINDYIAFLKKKGCKKFEIYEKDMTTLVKQLSTLNKKANINLKYSDILEADATKKNTLYDLDFCVSIKHVKNYVSKFTDSFIMTFSTRIGVKETIDKFFEARNENIVDNEEHYFPIPHTVYKTDKNNSYLFTKYHDTSAMCCFAKI